MWDLDNESHQIDVLMLIDDSDFDQRMYKRVIARSGLVKTLVQYVDPQRALEDLLAVGARIPTLVLLDINMPTMDGFEFLEIVQDRLGDKMCPVIVMLTTSLDPVDERRARDHAIVRDFLNKPLTQVLLEKLATY